MPMFLVFAACAFASSFSLRLIDPLILPVASHFGVATTTAALLSPAYALPYAISQPFLGPISDRFGRMSCMRVCMAGLAATLLFGAVAPTFEAVFASRVLAGIFGGGLVPLVLAGLGDAYDMENRQIAIGRMLVALIGGQMLGSLVAGLASDAWGWRSAFGISFGLAVAATLLAWTAKLPSSAHARGATASFRILYGRVFQNAKAKWVLGCVTLEGMLFFGFFPYVGEALLAAEPGSAAQVSRHAGLALGAFGIGGLVYAFSVRRLIASLGVARMCLLASLLAAAGYAVLPLMAAWWQVALVLLVTGLGFYMVHNSLQTEATELAPTARGSAVALFASGLYLGQGVGPLLFGPMAHHAGFTATFVAVAVGLVLLGQAVLRRVMRLPPAAADPRTA
jgi:MFS transporter, DHA1 family, inner membrane transport protein